jgi:hypothetical protein
MEGRVKGDDAFGYSPEEVRSMNALEMVEPRDRDLAAAKLHEGFVKGQTSVEITFMRKTATGSHSMSPFRECGWMGKTIS